MRTSNRFQPCAARYKRALVRIALLCVAPAVQANSDAVTWSDLATQALGTIGYEQVMRSTALGALAAFDAVNACEQRYLPYTLDSGALGRRPSPEACQEQVLMVAAAWHTVLAVQPGSDLAAIRRALDELLSGATANTARREEAFLYGQGVALALLLQRADDRTDPLKVDLLPAKPGVYRPLPGVTAEPFSARASTWRPFALRRLAAHAPNPAPAPESAQALAELDEVRRLGAMDSSERSADQTAAALYWVRRTNLDLASLRRPWMKAHPNSLVDALRVRALFALVAVDTMIAESTWHWSYQQWRPQQALLESGNTTWKPLLNTPNGPEHPSGVAIFNSATALLMEKLPAPPGTWPLTGPISSARSDVGASRSWASAQAMARDAGFARLWAGSHTREAVEAGLRAGRAIGEEILATQLLPK